MSQVETTFGELRNLLPPGAVFNSDVHAQIVLWYQNQNPQKSEVRAGMFAVRTINAFGKWFARNFDETYYYRIRLGDRAVWYFGRPAIELIQQAPNVEFLFKMHPENTRNVTEKGFQALQAVFNPTVSSDLPV